MGDETVQVLVVGTFDSEVASADVVDGLVVHHETAVRMLQCSMGCEDGVVWFDNSGSVLRCRVNAELEFALLAIIHREAFHQQGAETRTCTAAEGVEDKEALETTAVVCDTSNFVKHLIDELFSNGVVPSSIVVGGILFPCDHLLWMKQASIRASANFVDDIRFEIGVDGSWDVFAVSLGIVSR